MKKNTFKRVTTVLVGGMMVLSLSVFPSSSSGEVNVVPPPQLAPGESITVIASDEEVLTVSLSADKKSLEICGLDPEIEQVALFKFLTPDTLHFQVPQLPTQSNGCVQFTAPFTATVTIPDSPFPVTKTFDVFPPGDYLIDKRIETVSVARAIFTIVLPSPQPPHFVPPPLGCPDLIIDADGFDSPDDGIPGAVEVFSGAPLTDFAPTSDFGSGTGVDMFDNDFSGNWTEGDDLITEGEAFTGVPGSRNKQYDTGIDKVILDKDGSLVDEQPVSFDLDGMGAMLRIRYYDANGNGTWDNGEDIVFDANGNYIYDAVCPPPPELKVPVDIKPQSCPNPLNVNNKGVLPVAILGTPPRSAAGGVVGIGFDVTKIDLASIKLEGVSPLHSAFEDVATPFPPGPRIEPTDCTTEGPDGFTDLTLKFDNQAIVSALGSVTDKEVRVLKLIGNLKPEFGGTPIVGKDVVVIKKKR